MMAKTFLGQLVLRLQDEMSGKAKKAATDVTISMKKIEDHARRLAGAQWGTNFQRQIEKMGASARELEIVRRSWDRLHRDMQSKNLGTAMRKSEIGAWKVATLSHLAQVRSGLRSTEKEALRSAKAIRSAMSAALKPAYVAAGGYTGAYMVNNLGREAVTASSERQREYFRQKMANIPENEREQMFQRSSELSQKYPSAGITDIMEMARGAMATMGSTERGLAVLDQMVKGYVTLQSTKGTDVAGNSLARLIRGIDNLGQNDEGDIGIKATRDIIDGIIRSAQIEGQDIDPGMLYTMARRAKIAGPGLSTDFIMSMAPALMQDMGAEGFGTALSSAFQAFVIGANSNSSKVNIAEQRRLGIRTGEGKGTLVDSKLFGQDPYQWVKKNLIPALQRDNVDLSDGTAVSEAVAKTTKNTKASELLTKMITQRYQIDKNMAFYKRTQGVDAADQARFEDPFVAYEGFLKSFQNLAAAVGENAMSVIVPGLNAISNAVNKFSAMVKAGDPTVATGLGVAGVGAAGFGAYKIGSAIYGLITAGANLNAAALALQQAAAMQAGKGAAGDLLGGKNGEGAKAGWFAALLVRAKGFSLAAAPGLMAEGLAATPGSTFEEQVAQQAKYKADLQRMLGYLGSKRFWLGAAADPDFNARDAFAIKTGRLDSTAQDAVSGAPPSIDMDDVLKRSAEVGRQVAENLSPSAKPEIDTSSIDAAQAKIDRIKASLTSLSGMLSDAQSKVDAQMRRSFSDYGVSP
jgi:hypothetical protein